MKDNCQDFRDRIADLVSGILPEADQRRIEEHVASCPSCRAYLQALRQEDDRLTEHFAGIEEDLVQRQEHAFRKMQGVHPNEKRKRIAIWREIMRSPFSKLATAAAVVVVAAVTLVVLDQSATSAYALGDISAAFDQAHVIHVEGWQYFPRIRVEDGTSRPPAPIRTWIDLDNGRIRQMQVAVSQSGRMTAFGPPEVNTTVTVTETICDGSYMMTLDHAAKTATYTRIDDYNRELMAYQQSRMLWGQLCGQPGQLDDFAKTGQEEIDGRRYDIWQLDSVSGMGNIVMGGGAMAGGGSSGGSSGQSQGHVDVQGWTPSVQSRLWLEANTGRLGRAQVLSQIGQGHWQLEQDYHTIDYDVAIPEGTFSLEPPAGFTATNTMETAPVRGLPNTRGRCGNLEYSMPMNFSLSDGSIILAWQSSNLDADQSQTPLFANLTFGGALPKLPIEFYSLKPTGGSERETYVARHLGYTSKDGRLLEWALYVPRSPVSPTTKYLGYKVLYRFNATPAPTGGMGLRIMPGVPVKTTEDFDKWVLGAMAKCSDGSPVPADITYQKVCDLAKHARSTTN